MPVKIEKIVIHRDVDTDPDLSWLGKYANQPAGPFTIDRQERGDMGRNEFRYFNCGDNYKGSPAKEMEEYCEQDYKRAEAYNRGDWYMVGIWAEAHILIQVGKENHATCERIRSGGLWGIESDSDECGCKGYHEQIAEEQQVKLPPLEDDLSLHETGFDSLAFAILVARLEDDLGIDPFTISEDAAFPLTVGDFVRAYENVPA